MRDDHCNSQIAFGVPRLRGPLLFALFPHRLKANCLELMLIPEEV
jgi:hypothetical protein